MSKLKGLLLIIMILSVSILLSGFMDNTVHTKADEAEWSGSGSSGSGDDAFTIVEIVPYKGMGEIGYLIGGQEPVNQELMSINSATGSLSFLGGAISVYPLYTEKALPSSGTPDSGWSLASTYVSQDGYFEAANSSNGGTYSINNNITSFVRVPDQTGSYSAELVANTPLENTYQGVNQPLNRKNVKAYFVYGKPTGVPLFSQTVAYVPYSVSKNPNGTGDYDYDSATGQFLLNKGNGTYDVIFVKTTNTTNVYYMTADYNIVEDNSGSYSVDPGNINYVAKTGGNYSRVTGTSFTYTNNSNSNYRWIQATVPANVQNYQNVNGKIWVRGQKILQYYQYTNKVQLVNNEWFKRLTLGIPSSMVEDYPVKVVTITPDDLNKAENQHYIDDADMFYINANYGHNKSYISLYENYSFEGLNLPYNQKYDRNQNSESDNLNFAVHDLNWTSVEKIFKRAAGIGCYKAAMVIDCTFYSDAINGSQAYKPLAKSIDVSYGYNGDKATMCNMAKLFIMVYQRNMIDFYNSFMNPVTTKYLINKVNVTVNYTGTTGSFIRPDSANPSPTADEAIYWNGNTFLPFGLNTKGVMTRFTQDQLVSNGITNYNITATTTDLADNILITNGMDLFTSKFIQPLTIPSDVQDDAIIHLSSLDPNGGVITTDQITLAGLTNVITNNGTGYENVGGVSYPDGSSVEGVNTGSVSDPGSSEFGGDDGNLRHYKRVLNIEPTADFTTSENDIKAILSDYKLQIVNMTSTQFNGSIDDINNRYDMIYMGSGAGRFNYSGTRTDFNDNNLDGSIYFSEGDQINYSLITSVKYRGNDITAQKKREMESFLAAGYPIVLDTDLYQLTNVKSGTNIYNFISQSKGKTNFMRMSDYNTSTTKYSFLAKLTYGLEVIRPYLNLINPTVSAGATQNYIYVDPTTHLLSIKFKLIPRGSNPSRYQYNASLYLDKNGDGIFDASEQLTVKSNDGTSWESMRENNYKEYLYQFNMSDLNGVYQWKVIVKRNDNAEIRGSFSGYAANTNKKNIYILQIRDNSDSFNLANKVNDTASLVWKYAGENKLKDYNLIIDSMTVQEFQQMYTTAPYTSATASTTNKLSKYHLLILDNTSTGISPTNGALTNIQDELAKNLGVIFTKNALGYSKQYLYYGTSKYSFMNYETYNRINRNALPLLGNQYQLYIYRNLGSNGTLDNDSVYKTTYLTKTNEGSITQYPYKMNQAIKIAPNYYSENVTNDFDLTQSQRLIGWYSLSDSKSPVVQKEGLVTGGTSSDLYQGMYSSSPNDVKNNYYLFSNGNCFYSGIQLAASDQSGNDDEMKLFINTIMAAYKSCGRVVSNPPVIQITDPVPVTEADTSKSITITSEDIVESDFILTFEIKQSSSNMDLTIQLDGSNPDGSWNENIYPVAVNGSVGSAIMINNSNKVVMNQTYVVKIPITELQGIHILSLKATNADGNSDVTEVTLKYSQKPVITIEDPKPVSDDTTSYVYVDIDFNAVDTAEEYLNSMDKIRVVFKIDQALTNVAVEIESEGAQISGNSLDPGNVKIYAIKNGIEETTEMNLNQVQNGTYAMYIPACLMKDHSSREINIIATDTTGKKGNASVTLLRRSLFPLD